jgi:hypothetical protein
MEGDPVSFDFDHTRSISLIPGVAVGQGEVQIRDWDGTQVDLVTTRTNVVVLPVQGVKTNIARPNRSFNVSDPVGGYLIDPADPLDPITRAPTLPLLPVVVPDIEDGQAYLTYRNDAIDYERRTALSERPDYHAIRDNRTTPTFRVLNLQRLANPWADWDPVLNPYRTVDSASMNLTAYNGVIDPLADEPYAGPGVDPSGPSTDPADMNRDFAAMERGKAEKYPTPRDVAPMSVDDRRLLWPWERRLVRNVAVPPVPPSLGIAAYDDIAAIPSLAQPLAGLDQHYFSSTIFQSLGLHSQAYFDVGLDASKPFTWLTWNNRPYISQYELMLVPTTSSYDLLRSFSARAATDPYTISAISPSGTGFNHLPNFFLRDAILTLVAPPVNINLEFFRLLDFVEVPSRYVGTERMFVPNPPAASPQFEVGFNGEPLFGDMAPPFNHISRYRYPGKVNINTVFDRGLWTDLMRSYSGTVADYTALADSRRGLTAEVIRPFREFIAPQVVTGSGDNEGLLRRDIGVGNSDGLMVFDPGDFSVQAPHNNSDRNPYFRYDAVQRMGNLATTRSSVFSIWITVGYFEVDPTTGDLLTTDPRTCELGSDSGQITRHRGFFIFDRSIPVAFEKGYDHNVRRALLVESYIE